MADNVDLNVMSGGQTVATDDVTVTGQGASGQVQFMKLVDGTANGTAPVAIDLGVKANALRVVPVSDLTDATYIGDIKFGESLPAGTAAIGKLAANTGVDIGDVDVLSVAGNVTVVQGTATNLKANITLAAAQILATVTTVGTLTTITNDVNIADGGNSITVDNATISVVGGGTEATAQRVTIANDSTGLVSVDDGGGALTIDWAGTAPPIGGGTEATALKVTIASDSTGLLSVDDNGGSLTVDNGGTFATQATLQSGTAAIGKLAANSGVDIGDVTLTAGTNAFGKLSANSGVDIGDVDVTSVVLPRSAIGPGEPGTAVDSLTHVAINLTTGANQVLVSSAPNKQIWVYGYAVSCGDVDGQTVSLQDELDVALTGIMEFAQYGGISVAPSGNFSMPLFKLGTDKDLEIDITGGDCDGFLTYAIVSV